MPMKRLKRLSRRERSRTGLCGGRSTVSRTETNANAKFARYSVRVHEQSAAWLGQIETTHHAVSCVKISPFTRAARHTRPSLPPDGGRWAVRRIMAVRRHEGRRGRPLDVLVEWEGEDSDGDLWEESWVSITVLSQDLREEARRLENELFGPRGTQALSRRAERRDDVRQRQERERSDQQWSSRLRDRARRAFGS